MLNSIFLTSIGPVCRTPEPFLEAELLIQAPLTLRASSPVLAASKGGLPKLAERPVWKSPDANNGPPPRPKSGSVEETEDEEPVQATIPSDHEEEQLSLSFPPPSNNGGAASRASVPNGTGRQKGVPGRKKKVSPADGRPQKVLH